MPDTFAQTIDADWSSHQAQMLDEARSISPDTVNLATIALGAEALRRDEDLEEVLAASERWDLDGVYVVCERPKGEYLTSDASWLSNLLDLVAAFKLRKKQVVVGYSNHQMLVLAAAGADAIASGTWMNVRSFSTDKFNAQFEEEVRQRAVWYYCPHALSEYKLTYLDIARKHGALDLLAPPADSGSTWANTLFSGVQPTTVKWPEQSAFRHYLQCLRTQVEKASRSTFAEAVLHHEQLLDLASTRLNALHAVQIRGQLRDFRDCIDANRAALALLKTNRGARLSRAWSQLGTS